MNKLDTKLEKIIEEGLRYNLEEIGRVKVTFVPEGISKIKQTILKEIMKHEDWGAVPTEAIRKVLGK
ncbi:MAG: hypothetical protein HY865_22495 [Chloroflexi bacterium]|nr:hypothetical protein [Chloroflexota bacterium]